MSSYLFTKLYTDGQKITGIVVKALQPCDHSITCIHTCITIYCSIFLKRNSLKCGIKKTLKPVTAKVFLGNWPCLLTWHHRWNVSRVLLFYLMDSSGIKPIAFQAFGNWTNLLSNQQDLLLFSQVATA